MAHLPEIDHDKASRAVTAAEAGTDGEIVTVVARRSDHYSDIPPYWAVIKMLLVMIILAIWPGILTWLYDLFAGEWAEAPGVRAMLLIALILVTLAALGPLLTLRWWPLRLFLTPPQTKTRRVRRRALDLFRTAAEARTRGKTGVLIYLSLDEHRAELIADSAIHSRVAPEVWGDAMAALLAGVKQDRVGDGLADAVTLVGKVLTEYFPASPDDTNELPDRLIEL